MRKRKIDPQPKPVKRIKASKNAKGDVYDIDISESSSDNDEQKRERRGKRPQKLRSCQPSTRGRKTELRNYEPKNEAVSIGRKVATTKLSAADKDVRKSWPSPIYHTATGKETGNGQRQQLLGKTNMQFVATPTPLRSELGLALNVKQEQPETSTPDLWNPKASKNDIGRVTRSRLQKGVTLKQSPTLPYNDSTSGYVSGPDDSKPDSDSDVKPLKLKPSAASSFESHKKLDCKPSHKQTDAENVEESVPVKSTKKKENSQQVKQWKEWTRARMSELEELDSYELIVE